LFREVPKSFALGICRLGTISIGAAGDKAAVSKRLMLTFPLHFASLESTVLYKERTTILDARANKENRGFFAVTSRKYVRKGTLSKYDIRTHSSYLKILHGRVRWIWSMSTVLVSAFGCRGEDHKYCTDSK
jgi:hypothetical protein